MRASLSPLLALLLPACAGGPLPFGLPASPTLPPPEQQSPASDGPLLFEDDFDSGLAPWVDWHDSPGWVRAEDGSLVIRTPAADHDYPAYDGDETYTYGGLAAYCPRLDDDGRCVDPATGWDAYAVEVSVNVRRQLRERDAGDGNLPAAWEVGWLFFRFQDTRHYYFLLFKTHHAREPSQDYGGVELGKYNCPGDCGVFDVDSGKETLLQVTGPNMPTDELSHLELDRWYRLRIEVENRGSVSIRAFIDGEAVGGIEDDGTLEPLFGGDGATPALRAGGLGLYAEDSETWFDDLTVREL